MQNFSDLHRPIPRVRPAHTRSTPRHVLRCRRIIRQGCCAAIVVLHRSFGISKLTRIGTLRRREDLQGPGGLIVTPPRDAWCAAMESYVKGVEVTTVCVTLTLVFRGCGVCYSSTKTLRLRALVVNGPFQTHQGPPSDDIFSRHPQTEARLSLGGQMHPTAGGWPHIF
jgi:hypothetical protein